MRLYTKCDRCGRFAEIEEADTLPDGWWDLQIGIRGSNDASNREGERSVMQLCPTCDDALYDWFYDRPAAPVEGQHDDK